MTSRIAPKTAFLQGERRPLLYFVTSNDDKLFQARLLFSKFGLDLQAFQETPEYVEDYSRTKVQLLQTGVREVARSLGASALFFLEDTSVRIEAISTPAVDRPGLAIKEWFQAGEMPELAERIYSDGLDRSAVVRSDIALHVPGLERPVFFSGETHGEIAPTPPTFEQDPRYPWLRPDTFNGWLIPNGCDRRLGEMDFEASLEYDFRAIALRALIDRLEEYAAALNLPSQAYAVRRRSAVGQAQLQLTNPPAFLVVGYTCAGKTTFGEHATGPDLTIRHIEASHVMREVPLPEEAPQDLSAFARANLLMLEHGFDVVARRVVEIYGNELTEPFVITGLRTLQELEYLKRDFPWAQIVFVDASEATRYARFLARARPDDVLTLENFRSRDAEHEFFGLLGVVEQVADIRLKNEGPLPEYFAQIDAILGGRFSRVRGISSGLSQENIERSQLFRILTALGRAGSEMPPSEIEAATKTLGTVRRSSVRKILAEAPALVRRSGEDGASRFAISETGRSYLALLDSRLRETGLLR